MTSVDERVTFLEAARSWLDENVPERWRSERSALSEEEKIAIREEWDHQLFRGGYAGVSLPSSIGGQGRTLQEDVLFHELAAQAHAPEGLGRIGKILTVPTLLAHGSDWQRDTYIPAIISGEHVWCQGFSEPGAGSDLASVATLATKVDGGWKVSGQKIWTSLAQYSDRAILLARTSTTEARYRNLSFFLLDMKQSGVTFRTIRQMSGDSHFAELYLDDAFVADEDLVGDVGQGWKVAMTTLTAERGGIEAITRYVEMRGDLDLLLRCCASSPADRKAAEDFDTRLELVRYQVLKALDYVDDDVELFKRTCMLKVMWSDQWQAITEFAVALTCRAHEEHWRHQYLEIRSASIYSGSNEIQRNIIGDRVLGLPR